MMPVISVRLHMWLAKVYSNLKSIIYFDKKAKISKYKQYITFTPIERQQRPHNLLLPQERQEY